MKEIDRAGKCGLYCGACPFYRATVDPTFKERYEKEYGKWEEEGYCLGCSNLDERSWGNECEIVQCTKNQNVKFCHACSLFPCKKIEDFSTDECPHHHTAIKESKRMKEIGCKTWLTEQEKRWSCSKCGEPFAWYSKTCHQCGEQVFNCVAEDQPPKK
ncbi:MAG: DUF3795 domain-containing protein [Caldisericia bacterium]|nr:DUF3795 domain-containing protein [Caldisericia bacterium]